MFFVGGWHAFPPIGPLLSGPLTKIKMALVLAGFGLHLVDVQPFGRHCSSGNKQPFRSAVVGL